MARQECSTKITTVRITYSLTEEKVIIILTGHWNGPSSFAPWFGNKESLGGDIASGHGVPCRAQKLDVAVCMLTVHVELLRGCSGQRGRAGAPANRSGYPPELQILVTEAVVDAAAHSLNLGMKGYPEGGSNMAGYCIFSNCFLKKKITFYVYCLHVHVCVPCVYSDCRGQRARDLGL